MFSVYTSLYHIEKHNFPWRQSLENFVEFIGPEGELTIAVNKSEDNTLQIIQEFAADKPNVKIIKTSFFYDDIEMDGKIKNAALQATTKPIKIQMDADEIIPLSQKPKWEVYARELLKNQQIDCWMIPTLDVYGSMDKIRSDTQIGQKFRMHKEGFFRGVINAARRGDKIDTSRSDTCELIDFNGDLARCVGFVHPMALNPMFADMLSDCIFTVHLGYLSFEHRINVNNKLWREHWELRSGRSENVVTKISQLQSANLIHHNLNLE
jgi:glycosyltransferase involved in cell wall biosynthesis